MPLSSFSSSSEGHPPIYNVQKSVAALSRHMRHFTRNISIHKRMAREEELTTAECCQSEFVVGSSCVDSHAQSHRPVLWYVLLLTDSLKLKQCTHVQGPVWVELDMSLCTSSRSVCTIAVCTCTYTCTCIYSTCTVHVCSASE